MKTYLPKEKDLKANREWFLIDANDVPPGRIATITAKILRGKHKPSFTPHLDTGDGVIIINAEKIRLTGQKLSQKKYYRHSGKPGELKEKTAGRMTDETPEKVLFLAVKGMLPKNKHKKNLIKRIKIVVGENHEHEAQKPKKITIDQF